MKKPSIKLKKRIFAQCSLSFHPKIPLKHLYFAVFMAIYGRQNRRTENCHTHNTFVIKEITYLYGNMAIL